MRRTGAPAIIASVLAASLAAQTPAASAAARLAQARRAMGGASELAAVKALILTGQRRTRFQVMRRGVRTVEFETFREEIKVLLPDHYLIAYDSPTMPGLGQSREGFAGQAAIGQRGVGTWRNPETFGYLMLPVALATDTVFPFSLRSAAGDTLRFADPNGVEVFLDLDPRSGLPLRLRFEKPARTNDGRRREGTIPTVVEIGDYRTVGRLRLPHKLTRFERNELITEQQFASIAVNPPLTAASFK